MFDNLRQQLTADQTGESPALTPRRRSATILGLTPSQLFILALMLFLNVSVLGCFALVAFEKIVLPF